jgi:hypothetical protein
MNPDLGKITVEIWSWKGLDDGKTEEKVARRDPAFGNDVSGKENSSKTAINSGKRSPFKTTDSLRSGITTGPPPKMIVPARYRLANRLKPRGLLGRTPRKTIITANVTKKAAIIAVPNFKEKIRICNASGTILSCSLS